MADILDIVLTFLSFVPALLIIFFTFYLFIAGPKKNRKLIAREIKKIETTFKNDVKELIEDKSHRTPTGSVFIGDPKGTAPFKEFLVVFAMEDRHLLLTSLMLLFTKPNDIVALECDPHVQPLAGVHVIPWAQKGQIQRQKDYLLQLDDFTTHVKEFDKEFMVKTESSQFARFLLLGDERMPEKERLKILALIYSLRDTILRVTVTRSTADRPYVKIFLKITKDVNYMKYRQLLLLIAERINRIGKTKYMIDLVAKELHH